MHGNNKRNHILALAVVVSFAILSGCSTVKKFGDWLIPQTPEEVLVYTVGLQTLAEEDFAIAVEKGWFGDDIGLVEDVDSGLDESKKSILGAKTALDNNNLKEFNDYIGLAKTLLDTTRSILDQVFANKGGAA